MPKNEGKGGMSRKRGKSEAENGKREVSFEDDEQDYGEENVRRAKRVRFPKGKKDSHRDAVNRNLGVVEGEEDDVPVLSRDPRVAALERATRREKGLEQIRAEDTSVSNDVALAEEEYDEDDEERVEDGMRIEPFNLKQERQEGYFDAEGNYVEYRNEDDTKDAWLDSVEPNVRPTGRPLAQPVENSEDEELSQENIAGIKRRIADALQPGETVLRALRRLKKMTKDGNSDRMTGDTKALFDQLTEDAMKLLDNGEYNVYEEVKETFQREAEGYEALARLRSGSSNGAGPSGASSSGEAGRATSDGLGLPSASNANDENDSDVDMFGDNVKSTDNGGEVHSTVQQDDPGHPQGAEAVPVEGSGYVLDASSGYYYNSELGYYYDANSGLYCSASTGKWYKFDEEQNSYEEVLQ